MMSKLIHSCYYSTFIQLLVMHMSLIDTKIIESEPHCVICHNIVCGVDYITKLKTMVSMCNMFFI